MSRMELEIELARVRTELMRCKGRCKGVGNLGEDGVLPWPTMVSGLGEKISCVVVSLAPPRRAAIDRKLIAVAKGYGDLLEHCRGRFESSAFHSKLNAFRRELGLKDSAVWATLCRCERIKGQELPSETLQACAKHLARELEIVDNSVPIIAVGNRAFNALRQSFPDRFVINVPSPNGSRKDFQQTMDNKRLLDLAKTRMTADRPGALCLCPPCARKHLGHTAVH